MIPRNFPHEMSGRQNCQVYDIGDVIILAAVRHDKTSVQGHAAGYLYPHRKEDVHPSSAHAAPPALVLESDLVPRNASLTSQAVTSNTLIRIQLNNDLNIILLLSSSEKQMRLAWKKKQLM